MSALVLPGFLAFFVVALVVGVRLVALATRTRQLPELLIGVGVLGIGPIGFGGTLAALALDAGHPAAARFVCGLAAFGVCLGVAAKYQFNWRIYRPDSVRAAALAWLGVAAALAAFGLELVATGFAPAALEGVGWHLLRQGLQVGCLLWGAGEAFAYWDGMRRRAALGLADPLVANRVLLWGIGAGAAGLGSGIGTAVQLVTGRPPLELPWLTLCAAAHGLVAAVALWLAFVPPRAYRRWLLRRGAAPGAAAGAH